MMLQDNAGRRLRHPWQEEKVFFSGLPLLVTQGRPYSLTGHHLPLSLLRRLLMERVQDVDEFPTTKECTKELAPTWSRTSHFLLSRSHEMPNQTSSHARAAALRTKTTTSSGYVFLNLNRLHIWNQQSTETCEHLSSSGVYRT